MDCCKKYLLLATIFLAISSSLFAQERITVIGSVIDANTQLKLSGVNISNARDDRPIAQTDSAGNFSIQTQVGAQLLFSMVGYEIQKVTITKSTDIVVTMKSKAGNMNEVVVQAFSQKNKDLITGSTTRLSGTVVQTAPVSNFVELLQGRVAGVNVQNNTGSPGAIGTINVRGVSTMGVSTSGYITPTSPLFVIDGVPVDVNSNYSYGTQSGADNINPLSLIPPEDIETFDFLKDAAAISLYGSRGAYGVVVVTTKRGRSKVPVVSYRADAFMRSPPALLNTIGGIDERNVRVNTMFYYDTTNAEIRKVYINDTRFLADSLNPYYNNSTNWQSYFYRPTYNHTHNLQISGGDNNFSYKTNIGYYNEKGIIKNTDFSRFTLSLNARYQPVEQFVVTASILGAMGFKGNGSGQGSLQRGVAQGAATSSLLPPPSLFSSNSTLLEEDRKNNINKSNNIQGSVAIEYEFIPGLRAKNTFSYIYNTNNNTAFTPALLSGNSSNLYLLDDKSYTVYNLSVLQYNKTYKRHSLLLQGFNELNSYGFRANGLDIGGFANDQIRGPLGGNWSNTFGGTYDTDAIPLRDQRQRAYGGEVTYNFDKRYVVTFQYRSDISSTNGPSAGYTRSPTISGRWNFFREKFLEKYTWISDGAIRGSWGKVIKPVGTIFDVYGKYNVGGFYNNNPTVYFDFNSIPNTGFKPEVTTQANMGFDLAFFNSKLQFIIDAYYKATDNQIITIPLSTSTAFGSTKVNGGSVVNRGIEFTVNSTVFQRKDWRVFFNYNISYDKSTLVALPEGLRELTTNINDANINIPIVRRVGRPQFSNLMFINNGVYANNTSIPVNPRTGLRMQYGNAGNNFFTAGDPIWVDVNGDYVIDENDAVSVGNPLPLFVGGFNPSVQFKNFFFDMSIVYTLKRDIINLVLANRLNNYTYPEEIRSLQPLDDINYWQPINGDLTNGTAGATYPNPFDYRRARIIEPFRSTQTLFMEDGSYAKINSVSLRYRMNRNLIQKYGMSQLEFRGTMNNVYTFSKYSGMNPENVSNLGRDISGGYPSARGYSIGLSVQF